MNTSQAAFPNLYDLVELFYDRVDDLAVFSVASEIDVPVVYRKLLDHDQHMTVTVESHHGCPVDVQVIEHQTDGELYTRKIILTRRSDDRVVQFGIVRLHMNYLAEEVRSAIESCRIPLGRVLINHNVLRRVELGKLWRVTPGVELCRHFQLSTPEETFGRTAIIHCDGESAIELLEIVTPEPFSPSNRTK